MHHNGAIIGHIHFLLAPSCTPCLHGLVALYTREGLTLWAFILIVSRKFAQHSCTRPVPKISREGVVHQGGRALIPALHVHICPGLAELGPQVQPVCVWGIACVLARIMSHTDSVTGCRVCQLAYRRNLQLCWQSIHKCLLPAGPLGLLCELPVRTKFRGSEIATNGPQGPTSLL